jgi:hypothetical protein
VIHVATVHFRDERWVEPQLRYLERFADEELRVYAFLNGNGPRRHADRFFYATSEPIRAHAYKLNLLADVIRFAAPDPNDILLFLDGDAFPLAPLGATLRPRLAERPLVAVRRDENNGSPFPHPCFAATTVGFWHEIGGTWHSGDKQHWSDPAGRPLTDVGANLLTILKERGVSWHPLLRSNTRELHPLHYAVYGDDAEPVIVYHHGAGFGARPGRAFKWEAGHTDARASLLARALDALPRNDLTRKLRRRYHPVKRLNEELTRKVKQLDADVFERLRTDEQFWRDFVDPGAARPSGEPQAAGD